MATLSELVEIVAAVEGINRERVEAIARVVREAGLIATHGRGPSAAQMSETDAANLMIAVNAADTARRAPDVVRRFRELRTDDKRRLEFGQVLEEIIAAAIRLEIVDYLFHLCRLDKTQRERPEAPEDCDIRIEFWLSQPLAVIECRIPASAMPTNLPFYPQKSTFRAVSDRRTVIGRRSILGLAERMRR